MTIDQKERFRRILQCLSNGKLEMGRMDLQKALEYFSLAHSRAAEYADFIKINDIDKEPVCQKCMSGERVTIDANSEPVHTRDFVSGCNEVPTLEDYKRALHATRGVLYEVLRILHTIVKRNQGGYARDKTDINRAIELIVHTPGRGLDSSPAPAPQSTGRDFSWALLHMKAGNAVRRASWPVGTAPRNTPLMLLALAQQTKDSFSQFMLMRITVNGTEHHVWTPTVGAVLANDWELA